MRDQMLAEVEEQQASDVFLSAIRSLIAAGQVRITNYSVPEMVTGPDSKQVIGRLLGSDEPGGMRTIEIATLEGLKSVQDHQRRLAKPTLAITTKALIGQLAASGKLLNQDNSAVGTDNGDRTRAAKIANASKKVFRVRASELIDEPEFKPRSGRTAAPTEPSRPRVTPVRKDDAGILARRLARRLAPMPVKSVTPDAAISPVTSRGETKGESGQAADVREKPKNRNQSDGTVGARRKARP
jgi:hypothetical protein